MLLPIEQESLTSGRVDFNNKEFRKIINQKGLNIRWSATATCACTTKSTDLNLDLNYVGSGDLGTQNDFNHACTFCTGTGKIYHTVQNVQGIVTNANGEYINATYGGYRDGVINITLNAEHLASFGDRFELIDSVMLYQEIIEDNNQNTLSLRFPIQARTLELATGTTTVNVMYCAYTDKTTGLTVGTLVENTDFTVANNTIQWINKPANVGRYTFSYFIHPTYTCIAFANSVRDTHIRKKSVQEKNVSMPVRIQCKLEFLEKE